MATGPRASVAALALTSLYATTPGGGNVAAVPWSEPAAYVPKRELADVLDSPRFADLGASDTAVFCALWTFSGAEGLAWPGLERIARRAHVCRRTTVTALERLERAGLVARQVPALPARRRRESNTYRLPSPPARCPETPGSAHPRPALAAAPPRPVRPADGRTSPELPELPAVVHQLPDDGPELAWLGEAWVAIAPAVVPPTTARAPRPAAPLPALQVQPPHPAAAPGATPARVQVQPSHPKGIQGEKEPERTRAGAQASRAERAAQNRAAWAAREKRAPAPRAAALTTRAQLPDLVPDPAGALAALRAWRAQVQPLLPGLGP